MRKWQVSSSASLTPSPPIQSKGDGQLSAEPSKVLPQKTPGTTLPLISQDFLVWEATFSTSKPTAFLCSLNFKKQILF